MSKEEEKGKIRKYSQTTPHCKGCKPPTFRSMAMVGHSIDMGILHLRCVCVLLYVSKIFQRVTSWSVTCIQISVLKWRKKG